ncbi:hypothetical protein M408DRAFT_82702 [Serendipita vermifera MAFF 305830]|uniref:ACB domain-containing protein n=1 Tax=Serendipita vermifera MAFF 305830 TaxID=933852 RepID=A0A0C2W0F3_SERVB|nr:hypothetical protein M408DRAFT_82702 [Serendipita vermifera MAFF 305830]
MADKFDTAVKIVQELPKDGPVQPSTDDKLDFYGLYKFATVGAVNVPKPGLFDPAGKAKWNAWSAVATKQDMSTEKAKTEYVEKLIAILKANESEDSKALLAQLE